ncbi:MAG TPA: thioredoxin-dependent thiol peroxidase [Bacillota bacterium]|nr:thioredoxin-dependent thiol peroxidase [Bacillota bacterium]
MEIGEKAPDFTLQNQDGEDVQLADFKGKNVVLYFYPKDMTPGCTTQACDFRDHYDEFSELNAVILGVSPDPVERHQKFIDKYELPFHLLADVDHEVAKEYGVWQLKKMFGNEFYGIVRSTFIIDKEGKLVKDFRNVRVKGHVERALEFLKNEVK